ncbi:MAG: hypothetical protein R3B81_18215 [bacterium]
MTETNRAERAGEAAKVARRHRRERKRVLGWTAAALLGFPLLFAAVWCRMEVCEELRRQDELLARRDALQHARWKLTGEKSRLSTWEELEPRAKALGLREPKSQQVVWIARNESEDRR